MCPAGLSVEPEKGYRVGYSHFIQLATVPEPHKIHTFPTAAAAADYGTFRE